MADEPISTEVPETVTVDTGADKTQLGDLNKEFADFWKEADTQEPQTTSAPEAPTTGATQETRETRAEPPSKPAETPTKVTEAPSKPEFTDEEVQQMELPPNSHPKLVENFKVIKEHWVQDRARSKAEAERATKLQAELEEARKNAWTAETRADYEHAASIRRKFDFVSDPEFIQKFHAPVVSRFQQIMDATVQALPDKQAAINWANDIKQNYQPDQLPRDWWLNSVIAKLPNEMDRMALMGEVTDLFRLQKERDNEITRRTSDRSAYDNWTQERNSAVQERIQSEIMSEIGEQEKRIQEVLPWDIEKARTAEERVAVEEHNERFQKLNNRFVETMKDISGKGPRGWVRAAVEATRAMLLEGEYKKLEEENKSLKTERDQLKNDLEKIAGARRRIAHTTGTPPTPTGTKNNNSTGLSIKNLDIRKAFDDYDWGER